VLTKPDVSLSIGEADRIKLALAFRVDGAPLQELATADCGRLELYRGKSD